MSQSGNQINIFQEISRNRLFRKIEDESVIEEIIDQSRVRNFSKNQVIYEQGEIAESLFLIPGDESGGVLLRDWLDDISREIDIDRIWGGDFFGEMEVLANLAGGHNKPIRKYKAEAIGGISLIEIDARSVIKILNGNQYLRQNAINRLIERYDSLSERLSEARLGNLDIRLARLLCDLSAQLGVSEGRGFRLRAMNNQEKLARHLSIDRTILSRKLNIWQREGLILNEKGSLIVKDSQRLQNIAAIRRRPSQDDHQYFVDEITKHIQRGENFRARNISLDLLDYFPNSSRIKYLAVLSSARASAPEDALLLIKKYGFEQDQPPDELKSTIRNGLINPVKPQRGKDSDSFDELNMPDNWEVDTLSHGFSTELETLYEDVIALHPRILKDFAFFSSDAAPDTDLLRQSLSGYEKAFSRVRRSYVGINAAALALMCKEKQLAQKYAGETLKLTDPNSNLYWDLATGAEACIILDQNDRAQKYLAKAVEAEGCTTGSKATTRLQLRRLEASAGLDLSACLKAIRQPKVAIFTGHMMLQREIPDNQQQDYEKKTISQIEKTLTQHEFGFAYGSLACGADILFAEFMLRSGCELHAVLPLPLDEFLTMSVLPGEKTGSKDLSWQERFYACLSQATTVTTVHTTKYLKRNIDEHMHSAAIHAMGLALLKADEVVTDCEMLSITNGSEPKNIAGAAMAAKTWQESTGRAPINMACAWRRPQTEKSHQDEIQSKIDSRPHLFVWTSQEDDGRPRKRDAADGSKHLTELAHRIEKLLPKKAHMEKRELAATSFGVFITLNTLPETIRLAERLSSLSVPGIHGLRLICDYGIVNRRDGKALENDIRALSASKDVKDLPLNRVCATERFATQARVKESQSIRLHRMGFVSVHRPLPSMALYRASARSLS